MNRVDPKKYVVLDVETNGLSSLNDDLLSISIYKPDDKKEYTRFLPLELQNQVLTTWINGITKRMLKNQKPLNQEEFNNLIKDFELDKRTILTYGNIDEKFIKNYLKRKRIFGFDKLSFFNFKHNIISSTFSGGNITKDNLCKIFGIDNVKEIHEGINDCRLEWQLFKKMNNNKLIVISDNVFEFNTDYIIPASYLSSFPNFKYCINNFPKINYSIEEYKKFIIKSPKLKKFENNISGITIEHLINSLLNVKDVSKESREFLIDNRSKLKRVGLLPSVRIEIPITLNNDGTVSAVFARDAEQIEQINAVTNIIKEQITPLIDFIKNDIFKNDKILSQELVINKDDNVLALCDLSNKNSILEIKTYIPKLEKLKYQLYYQSNGRDIFFLQTDWKYSSYLNSITFTIYKVNITVKKDINQFDKIKKDIQISTMIRRANDKVRKYYDIHQYNISNLKWLKIKKYDCFNYNYLKTYLSNNNISVKELSYITDIHEQELKKWLNGELTPSVWQIMYICSFLEIDEKNLIIKKEA